MNILIVDNDETMRSVLRFLLSQLPESSPACKASIFDASGGAQALNLCRNTSFDLVLMDLNMAGMDGIETTDRILDADPETRVLVISMHNNASTMNQLKRIGACGYLVKDKLYTELTPALEAVCNGQLYFPAAPLSGQRFRPKPNAAAMRRSW